jgi:hypothetical protein
MSETQRSAATRKSGLATFICRLGVVIAMLGMGSPARSAPAIIDITIVEVLGRPGHEGFFPIQGDPIAGSLAFVRARLASAANRVTLNLRDPGGALIGQVPMIVPPADTWPPGTYFAEFQVPTVPFALSVSGADAAGNGFEIASSGVGAVSPQTVALRLIPTVAELPAGIPFYVTVQATNSGAPNTFTLALTSTAGATVTPANVSVKLDSSQTAGAQFQVMVPANLSGTFTLSLKATATSSAPAGSTNKAVLELPLAMQPTEALSAWVRPNEKRDLIHIDRDGLINIWVCDTGVNGNSVNIANALAPVQVQQLAVAQADRKACGAPSAFQLTFKASDLVTTLTITGLSAEKNREIQVPLIGLRSDGTPLIGYVPLLF